jgi:hypothetical protein
MAVSWMSLVSRMARQVQVEWILVVVVCRGSWKGPRSIVIWNDGNGVKVRAIRWPIAWPSWAVCVRFEPSQQS